MVEVPGQALASFPQGRLHHAARRCLWMAVAGLVALVLLLLMPRFATAQGSQLLNPRPVGMTGELTSPSANQGLAQLMSPPASGASSTGYDSLNRKRTKGRARAGASPATAASSAALSPPSSSSLPPLPPPTPRVRERVSAAVVGTVPGQPVRRRLRVEDDPFGQVGFFVGTMLVKTAVELSGGYDTNPARVTGGKGGAFYFVAPELLATSDWSRHSLTVDLRGSYTGYGGREFADVFAPASPNPVILDRPQFTGRIYGRYDVTRDLRIEPELRAAVSTDNPGSPDIQAGLQRYPLVYSGGATLGVAQRFNRLDLSLKGTADRSTYADSRLTNGASSPNSDRNVNQYAAIGRASYELTPGVKPFVEAQADRRVHDTEVDRSGFNRDSSGGTVRAGTTFELTRLLTGEISAGYTQRRYEDAQLRTLDGLLLDASLVWSATPLTKLTFTAKSGVGETTLPGVSGSLTRDLGVQVDHDFRRWLVGTARLGYGTTTYDGINREDTTYTASGALAYKLSRAVHLKGEYRHEWVQSSDGSNYNANVYLVGVRVQR